MRIIISLIVFFFYSCINANAQEYKFDFGEGSAPKGYIKVTPQSYFDYQTGYGFDKNSSIKSVMRKLQKPLVNDFITSDKPFFFSVKVPEGNYDVKIIIGDVEGVSATTIRAECRRLFLQNVRTAKGEIVTKNITIHVRDSLIRDQSGNISGKVKLKPREFAYLHWDNMLTLEFNDSSAKICAVEISANKLAPTIFLAGNSTVVDQDREPWAAWGQMFPVFFEGGSAVIANYAESGEAMRSFKSAKRLEKIWSMSKPGDYLFIEFAHNDQKQGGSYLDPFTTYKTTIKEWISESKKRQMTPVLVTSMHRRNFDSLGHIINTLSDYPEAMRQVAKEENVALVDLNAMSKILYEAWGEELSLKAFVHYLANSFPGQDKPIKDNTHFSPYGAYELAKCVVQSIKDQQLPLAKYLKKTIPLYNPAKPTDFKTWYWPSSILLSAIKPDGN